MTIEKQRNLPGPSALPYHNLALTGCGASFDLLSDVTIVDLTTSVAGPYSTMLLSDFGANIIKVERPEGDDARKWGPPFLDGEALWFAAVNRNKKSVVLDLRTTSGMATLKRLISTADVFVTNQPPDVQKKLGLDYEAISAQSKDIVFASITGFGLTGERAALTSYDLIAEGYSGVMDLTGDANSPPQKVGAPAADMLAGQDAAMAILAALFDRRKTGKGRKIDISLAESMTRFLTCRISSYLGSGEIPTRSGGTDSVIAIYQSFQTADKMINLGLGSDAIWARFWTAVGDVAFGERAEFSTNAKRRMLREEIVGHIQQILLTRRRDEWLQIFAKVRVPAGPINEIDEVTADPGFQERGLFFALLGETGRIVPQTGLGIHVDDKTSIPRSLPPRLGEHTQEILDSLSEQGFDP